MPEVEFPPNRIREVLREDIAFSDSQIIVVRKQPEAGIRRQSYAVSAVSARLPYTSDATSFGGMDESLMARSRELQENLRVSNIYAVERLKAEVIQEAMAKSAEAIAATRDGAGSGLFWSVLYQARMACIRRQHHVLSLSITLVV